MILMRKIEEILIREKVICIIKFLKYKMQLRIQYYGKEEGKNNKN
jgi:hypothetical protein